MLKELIQSGFGETEDYNCAEKILYGANQVYGLGLDVDSLRLAAGFGGGVAIGDFCGALSGAVMVLSNIYVDSVAHRSAGLKPSIQAFLANYQAAMGDIHCEQLKEKYRTPEKKCFTVIEKAAELLDEEILKYRKNNC